MDDQKRENQGARDARPVGDSGGSHGDRSLALRRLRHSLPLQHPALPLILSIALLAAVVPSGQAFTCTPESVWDGDGPIWCKEGPRIRLAGIAAREIDGSCKAGHPCPAADPIASRDHLVRLVGEPAGTARTGHILVRGPAMRCISQGSAGGNRTAAFCVSPRSGDLSCAMVRAGFAEKWDRYWRSHRCDRATR